MAKIESFKTAFVFISSSKLTTAFISFTNILLKFSRLQRTNYVPLKLLRCRSLRSVVWIKWCSVCWDVELVSVVRENRWNQLRPRKYACRNFDKANSIAAWELNLQLQIFYKLQQITLLINFEKTDSDWANRAMVKQTLREIASLVNVQTLVKVVAKIILWSFFT